MEVKTTVDNDYQNFVSRMGSFEDEINIDDDLGHCQELGKGYLEHYGVMGMRWGKRKAALQARIAEKKAARAATNSDDYNNKVALRKKKMRQMSNAELRALNNRLQLERQYKDLRKQDVAAGQKFATDIVGKFGKDLITDIAVKSLTRGVDGAVGVGISKGLNTAMNYGLNKNLKR